LKFITYDEARADMKNGMDQKGLTIYGIGRSKICSARNLRRVLNGKAQLTPKMAILLGEMTEKDPVPWIVAHAIYELDKAYEERL
jgi:plasmid maintenance system antidote protein VapI